MYTPVRGWGGEMEVSLASPQMTTKQSHVIFCTCCPCHSVASRLQPHTLALQKGYKAINLSYTLIECILKCLRFIC
jgi:hypothetical protein